jgi:cobalt-zinc-cadmium efflux system outer membrane protein
MCVSLTKSCVIVLLSLAVLAGCRSVRPTDSLVIPAPAEVAPPKVMPASFLETAADSSEPELLDAPRPVVGELLDAPLPVMEDQGEFGLTHFEVMATSNSPALGQVEAALSALRGKWVQAGLPPNPTIGYMASDIGEDGGAGKQGGYVGQTFVRGGKLGLDQAVISQEVAAADQKLVARRERVLTDVRLAYYDVLIAQRRVEVATELVTISRQAVEASENLLKAKDIPRVGLLQTQVQLQNNEITLRRAENENDAAWRRLSSVVGQPNLERRKLTGDLDTAVYGYQWEEQLQRLISSSPEIARAVAELEGTGWALQRAFAQNTSDIAVQISVQSDDATGATLTGIQLGLPLPLWNRNQGGIHQAHNDIVSAERNLARVELGLRNRLAKVFRQYADARYQATKFSKEVIPKAKQTLDLVTQGYKLGEIGYLDQLAANRTYFQTRQSQIDALQDLWRARLLIDGMLLDDSLSAGDAE